MLEAGEKAFIFLSRSRPRDPDERFHNVTTLDA